MKSILIIGMGDFGRFLCRELAHLGNEIMIVDEDEKAIEDFVNVATSSLIADCTQESVLKRLGVANFDICFVCISRSFQNNLVITSLLKDLGAQYVVSQANDELLAKFLLRNGADEIIHPNRDSAIRAAVKYNNDNIFDFIDLKDGYSIYEITPLAEWVGKSIIESDIHAKYDVYIIGIMEGEKTNIMPSPQTVIKSSNHLMVLAHETTMEKLIRRLGK